MSTTQPDGPPVAERLERARRVWTGLCELDRLEMTSLLGDISLQPEDGEIGIAVRQALNHLIAGRIAAGNLRNELLPDTDADTVPGLLGSQGHQADEAVRVITMGLIRGYRRMLQPVSRGRYRAVRLMAEAVSFEAQVSGASYPNLFTDNDLRALIMRQMFLGTGVHGWMEKTSLAVTAISGLPRGNLDAFIHACWRTPGGLTAAMVQSVCHGATGVQAELVLQVLDRFRGRGDRIFQNTV